MCLFSIFAETKYWMLKVNQMVPPWGRADSKPDFCTAKDILNNYSSDRCRRFLHKKKKREGSSVSNETHLAPFSLTQTAGETIPETLINLSFLSMKFLYCEFSFYEISVL